MAQRWTSSRKKKRVHRGVEPEDVLKGHMDSNMAVLICVIQPGI